MGLVSCGVACLGEASGFERLSDSRYVLIPDLIEAVKEIPFDPEPDARMERGEHSIHCQSSSVFEEMALLISLLSPNTTER